MQPPLCSFWRPFNISREHSYPYETDQRKNEHNNCDTFESKYILPCDEGDRYKDIPYNARISGKKEIFPALPYAVITDRMIYRTVNVLLAM